MERFGAEETNERGKIFLQIAHRYKMTLVNTLFPRKISRRTKWYLPNGVTHNQIDYILAPWQFKLSINRAKSRAFLGADIHSDHDLVIMTMKLILKKNLRNHDPNPQFNLEELKAPQVADLFKATIGDKFAALDLLKENI